MDNRLVIKKVAHNWQDWPSGKNYKTPSGPSLLTASARNRIQSLLTCPTNYYFQQSIFSYSKITAVYLFIYFCLFFFFSRSWFYWPLLCSPFSVSHHTQILVNWVLLFQCFCFFWHLIVKTVQAPKWSPVREWTPSGSQNDSDLEMSPFFVFPAPTPKRSPCNSRNNNWNRGFWKVQNQWISLIFKYLFNPVV